MTSEQSAPVRPRVPVTLAVAVGVVFLEALALVVAAGAFAVAGFASGSDFLVSLLGLAAMFVLLAVGLLAVCRSLLLMHRWARPATVAWQVLLVLFGISMSGTGWWAPVVVIVPALVCLVGLFHPRTVRAYEEAVRNQESRNADD